MTLEMLLAVIEDNALVAVQVVDPETGRCETLVGPTPKSVLNRALRSHLNSELFGRTVESVRAFRDYDSQWADPELFIGVI